MLIEYNQRFFEFDKNSEKMALDQNDSLVYKNLFDNNPLNVNHKLFSLFENKLRNDSKFATTILDKMLCEYFQTKIYHQFKNKDQFYRVSQVLTDICMNKDLANYSCPNFDINFVIIYIAERGFFLDEKNKRKYLCSVLGEKGNIAEINGYSTIYEKGTKVPNIYPDGTPEGTPDGKYRQRS